MDENQSEISAFTFAPAKYHKDSGIFLDGVRATEDRQNNKTYFAQRFMSSRLFH
jgi:hypothetical protein